MPTLYNKTDHSNPHIKMKNWKLVCFENCEHKCVRHNSVMLGVAFNAVFNSKIISQQSVYLTTFPVFTSTDLCTQQVTDCFLTWVRCEEQLNPRLRELSCFNHRREGLLLPLALKPQTLELAIINKKVCCSV